MRAGLYLGVRPADRVDRGVELSGAADVARPPDGDQAPGLVPLRHLDVCRRERSSRRQAAGDDSVSDRGGEPEEVAPEVDCDPGSRARVLDGVPARRIDARRQGAAVEERSRVVASERSIGRIESQHHRIVTQFDRHEPDCGVER